MSVSEISQRNGEVTFNWLAIPGSADFGNGVCDRPVLVPSFYQAHGNLSSVPCRLQDICPAARYWVLGGSPDDQGLSRNCGKAVDVCADVYFDNIVLCEDLRRERIRAVRWTRMNFLPISESWRDSREW